MEPFWKKEGEKKKEENDTHCEDGKMT